MKFDDVLKSRCSIRNYLDKKVEQEKIDEILAAGFMAPSGCNLRPYHFIVIDEREILDKLVPTSPGKRVLKNAPMAIAVVGDKNIGRSYELIMNDTSACIENMLLKITDLGLGGCWLAEHREEDQLVNEILNLPEGLFVGGFIAFGYPNETKNQPNRFDKNKIHYNKW